MFYIRTENIASCVYAGVWKGRKQVCKPAERIAYHVPRSTFRVRVYALRRKFGTNLREHLGTFFFSGNNIGMFIGPILLSLELCSFTVFVSSSFEAGVVRCDVRGWSCLDMKRTAVGLVDILHALGCAVDVYRVYVHTYSYCLFLDLCRFLDIAVTAFRLSVPLAYRPASLQSSSALRLAAFYYNTLMISISQRLGIHCMCARVCLMTLCSIPDYYQVCCVFFKCSFQRAIFLPCDSASTTLGFKHFSSGAGMCYLGPHDDNQKNFSNLLDISQPTFPFHPL